MIKLRTCIKCKKKLQQNTLIRLQIKDGILIEWNKNGRSFYLCKACIINCDCINSIYKIKTNHTLNKDVLAVKLKEICDRWQKQ